MAAAGLANRALAAVAAGLFLLVGGAQVIRAALVRSGDGISPGKAALWPDEPQVLGSTVMREIGEAAGRGREPAPETVAMARRLTVADPLAAEPFLLEAALAVRGARYDRAERLLRHARMREPRSPAARYLLADLYLRTGRPELAMAEMAILNRLLPGAATGLAASLAAYAKTPGALPRMRHFLGDFPELEAAVLTELASDVRNVDLVMALARPQPPAPAPVEWQQRMFIRLIDDGQYAKAHAIWSKLSGVRAAPGELFNPGFTGSRAPPPFNWEFPTTRAGFVETGPGRLQVLFFGREDGVFARQTLLLRPGSYRLAASAGAQEGDARSLRWRVTCAGSAKRLLELPLAAPGSGRIAGAFTVPAQGCGAQQLELAAVAPEFPERVTVRVSQLELARTS